MDLILNTADNPPDYPGIKVGVASYAFLTFTEDDTEVKQSQVNLTYHWSMNLGQFKGIAVGFSMNYTKMSILAFAC